MIGAVFQWRYYCAAVKLTGRNFEMIKSSFLTMYRWSACYRDSCGCCFCDDKKNVRRREIGQMLFEWRNNPILNACEIDLWWLWRCLEKHCSVYPAVCATLDVCFWPLLKAATLVWPVWLFLLDDRFSNSTAFVWWRRPFCALGELVLDNVTLFHRWKQWCATWYLIVI